MKVQGNYSSIIRGVSQQVPHERQIGQCTEQVNLLSDPVAGLVRRHGSELVSELIIPGTQAAEFAAYVADTNSYRTIEYTAQGIDYVVLVRTQSAPTTPHPLPPLIAYNRTAKVFCTLARNTVDVALDALTSGGVSAITAVGKYLFMAGHSNLVTSTSTDKWNNSTNLNQSVLWVRGGAFSRTYSATVTRSGGRTTFSYTTPTSSYQTALDTSDIPSTATDYTKQVNDRVNAYTSAVTAWIGSSTAAVQPAAIAEQLRLAAVAAGVPATRQGSHVIFSDVTAISSDDGGDGTLLRGVADEIESVDRVSVIHAVGKVVKVRSRNAQEAYYLRAIAKDKTVSSGYTEVTWIEGAGVEHSITGGIQMATIVGNVLYVASTSALLTSLIAGPHPSFTNSTAGDNDSSPRPFFLGKSITYLGVFQNRLLVGCGGVLACSKTDDYFNFFRSTVLTLPAGDAFEMLSAGGESDELRYSTMYDRDLIIFGTHRQYLVSGRIPLSPTNANMSVLTQFRDVADCPPLSAGGFVFYAKRGDSYSSLHQIQPGRITDSPEAYTISSQISSYLAGGAVELVHTIKPSMLAMRTTGSRQSIYTFGYFDSPEGRKLDAWSRWDFASELGVLMGVSVIPDNLLAFSLRLGAGGVYVVCDSCSLLSTTSTKPYLDSNRPLASVSSGAGSVVTGTTGNWFAAFGTESARRFAGSALSNLANLQAAYPGESGLYVGAVQSAYIIPTNPYIRDTAGKAILSGRFTVTSLNVSYKDTTGLSWRITYHDTINSNGEFNGRTLDDPVNLIGYEPISSGQHTVVVGRETKQYSLKLSARKWFPFNITALEWVGQFFNRTQRY